MTNHRLSPAISKCLSIYFISALLTPAYSACTPPGTPGDDIIVCVGVDVSGVDANSGDDQVSTEEGSSIIRSGAVSLVSSNPPVDAEFAATAIDAGDGDDKVTQNGSINLFIIQLVDPDFDVDDFEFISSRVLGIDTGGGSDDFDNQGDVHVNSGGFLPGFAPVTQVTTAGVSTGNGPDLINNSGTITVVELVFPDVRDVPRPISIGVDAGAGDDSVSNDGQVGVTSFNDAYGISTGEGDDSIANLGLVSVLSSGFGTKSIGIDSADGDDTVTNTGSLAVEGNSPIGISSGLGIDAIRNTGMLSVQSRSGASGVPASSTGILMHGGPNTVDNSGHIEAMADAETGLASSGAMLNAQATGIEIRGEHAHTITNSGSLTASADSSTIADSSTVQSSATGLLIAGEEFSLVNTGSLIVEATALSDPSTIPIPLDDAEGHAGAGAVGIRILGGTNTILNTGVLEVTSDPVADTNAGSISVPFTTLGAASTVLSSDSAALSADQGNISISNLGEISLVHSPWAEADAVATGKPPLFLSGSAVAAATVESSRIHGIRVSASQGKTEILNDGSMSIVIGRLVDGVIKSAEARADATVLAFVALNTDATATVEDQEAVGINVGDGDVSITNRGSIDLTTNMGAYAEAFGDTVASVTVSSYGIRTGNGPVRILNDTDGSISVVASAYANAYPDASISASAVATADASAYGIAVGESAVSAYRDSEITNRGDVTVVAFASTREDGSETGEGEALAVGIQGGIGIDVIRNYGSIDTSEFVDFEPRRSGVAIRSRGGDDQVFLYEGSSTRGHVDLGTGNNTLVLDGAAIVEGDIRASGVPDYTDKLVLRRNGEFVHQIEGIDHILKEERGTFRIAAPPGLPVPSILQVDEGVLSFGSSYVMAEDGRFHVRINPDGSENKLNIETGSTSLDGDLHVVRSPGVFLDGDSFDIITAPSIGGAISGEFASESLPEATPLLSFSVAQKPNEVEVVAAAKPFGSVAENRVERAVGNYMDAIAPSATGDLSNVLGEFQQLPESEFETAFSSLSPDSYGDATLTTYRVVRQYTRGLQWRLYTRRLLELSGGNGETQGLQSQGPVLLAANDTAGELGGLFQVADDKGRPSHYGLWLDAYGLWGDQDDKKRDNWTSGGYTGFDFNTYGITLGYDRPVSDRVVAGLSVGYAMTDIDLDDNAGDGDIDSGMVSLYGEYQGERAYLDAVLTYGRMDYDNTRNLQVGAIQRTARSDHDGTLWSAYLEGGHPIYRDQWQIEPFLSLQYIHLDEDSFRESGAGDVNLDVDDDKTESLVSQAGIRAAHTTQRKSGRLVMDAGLAWVHDFDIDDRVITASYTGAPATAFSVKGRNIDRNGAALDLGLTFQNKRNLTTSVRLGAEISDNYHDKGIMGQIRYEF